MIHKSMSQCFTCEAPPTPTTILTGTIDETERPKHGHPERAPGLKAIQRNSATHQRVQFLRLSAISTTSRGPQGATPPFQPAAPSLSRVANDEEENELLVRSRQRSPLRNLALSNHRPVDTSRYGSRVQLHEPALTQSYSKMPHAVNMPYTGFQALILCGPGIGLSTFTSLPREYPKALVQIANRPMVWYVLDWCYRAGVTDITLITPPEAKDTLAAALAQEPHLTSLPSPSPDLLAPADLEYETATAELLRLPEVQKAIRTDFILLPCDLICDIQGETFLDTYLTSIGGLGGAGVSTADVNPQRPSRFGLGGESSGRRGGLSIWYNTANREESVKKEECDIMCTAPLDLNLVTPTRKAIETPGTLRNLVWTMPMSELKEQAEEDKSWRIRSSLLRKHGNIKCMTQYRDAHIYFLPYWVKEFAAINEDFESFTEDLVGTWAKADWRKPDYRARFGSSKIFAAKTNTTETEQNIERPIEDEVDLLSLSSTQTTRRPEQPQLSAEVKLASRVQANPEDSILSDPSNTPSSPTGTANPPMPTISAYILPSAPTAPLVRRIDTTPLLLSISLLLAKTSSIEEDAKAGISTSSPFAHSAKIHGTASIAQQVTVSRSDTLIGANSSIATRCVIKNSVIGANVSIGSRTRITGSVIMDGATVGDGVELNGTVIGKKCKIGHKAKLTTCEVQDGNIIADEIEGRGEKFLVGGMDAEDGDEFDDDYDAGDGDEEDEDMDSTV